MPAPKKQNDFGDRIVGEVINEHQQLLDLLGWVATVIVTRNANGKKSDKFCRLCASSKLNKLPCRHADIWRLTK